MNFSSVLVTIALNVLKKLGLRKSFVFSPISILLASAKHPNSAILNGIQNWNETHLVQHAKAMGAHYTKSYSMGWKFSNSVSRKFELDRNTVKTLNFIMMDKEKNMELHCDEKGARMETDDYFDVLEIPPVSGELLRFVAFLPNKDAFLSESLKNLTTTRFHKLMDGLYRDQLINYRIPTFQLNSSISISKLLDIHSNRYHKFHFKVPGRSDVVTPHHFVKKPCNRDPYYFKLNRPFVFAVLNNTIPVVMGVFNGSEK